MTNAYEMSEYNAKVYASLTVQNTYNEKKNKFNNHPALIHNTKSSTESYNDDAIKVLRFFYSIRFHSHLTAQCGSR